MQCFPDHAQQRGPGRLNGVIVTADLATGRATSIQRLSLSHADVDALAPQAAGR